MDDGRRQSLTTILLMLLLGGSFFALQTMRSDEPTAAEELEEAGEADAPEALAPAPVEAAGPAVDEAARSLAEQTATLSGEGFEAVVTNLNGGLRSVRLLDERFQDRDGQPYDVVTTDKERFLPFQIELAGVPIPPDAVWALTQDGPHQVTLRWEGAGVVVTRVLTTGGGPYQIASKVSIRNARPQRLTTRLRVKTFHYVANEDEAATGLFGLGGPGPGKSSALCLWNEDDVVRHARDAEEIQVSGERFEDAMGWGPGVRFTGLENRYFANVLVAPSDRVERCRIAASERGNPSAGALFQAQLSHDAIALAAGTEVAVETVGYFGPKDPKSLAAAGHQLEKVVDLGFFAPISGVLADMLSAIEEFVGNWGLAIILLTFFIRMVLFPLTFQSFKSMARMRLLKPEMDRINELYADDAEKKGAAIMELYRKHKVNPVSGCLPQLLQLPIWFALYTALSTSFELYHAPFLVWRDLSASDPFFILPLSVGGLIFVQQKLSPAAMDPAQAKVMLYVMPAMITSFMLFLPAGLCIYIATNSVLGIAQQKWIERRLERQQAPDGAEDSDGSGGAEDGGGGAQHASEGNGHAAPVGATVGSMATTGSSSSTVRTRKPDRRRKRRGRA